MDNKLEREEARENHEALPGYTSIDNFTKDGFKILMESIRNSNALPLEKDWNFFNTNDTFTTAMNEQGNKILSLINNVMRKYNIEENIKHRTLPEKIELVINTNDSILEGVANCIDEINGVRKASKEPVLIQTVSAQLPINGSWNKINKATFSVNSPINKEGNRKKNTQSIHLLTAKNIIRPQKFFKDKINNSNKYPWEPRITEKPNSIKPLALYLEDTEFGESFCHPYELELEKFTPTEEQLKIEIPTQPKPIEKTPLYEVDTVEKLQDLLNELYKHKEFAVDLEHHSYRSFMGITCLMQISTCDADYLIDTLKLRDKLYILNEVFTKPNIVKIFHGADLDIQWLQRDLSIYIVNMFDTHQAAKQLGYSGLSLSYLLNRFCNFLPNKQFQLADWRIRPLPDELKSYAREDTHYLIYIYHILKNELHKTVNNDNIVSNVIHKSTEICRKRYFKPILTDESHINFYRKCKRMFDNRQMYALKQLYAWRDTTAREEDESTGYVLPNHMLLQIAEALPREMQGILACCNPIPPLVRSNLLELHQIILKAREQSLQKPIMHEENRSRGSTRQLVKINVNNPLNCPHDLTKSNEFRDDLPTLLGGNFKSNTEIKFETAKSKISAFNDAEDIQKVTVGINKLKFLGPYERYKLVKPYIQAEEKSNTKTDPGNTGNKEDKIAMLHPHFVQQPQTNDEDDDSTEDRIKRLQSVIAEETKLNNSEEKSLIALGGTKKRKRDSSVGDNSQMNKRHAKFEDNFQTTIPNLPNRNTPRKRKHDNEDEPRKSKQNRNYFRAQKWRDDKKQIKPWNKPKQETQNACKQEPFDYSAVDYKQFQGGASGIQTNKRNLRSNFKAKGKKKKFDNKAQNKSSTFGMSNFKRK